ncbi:hypothetical protein E2C01_026136 [Portunus trituberculatus]|uniref:Uncharacterized protein n=1 Tax=Portunus trituberculatus TaxID=210409 RepID=A0A5B7EHK1_PORTR|nr:hypothetical protein [Portunus trituberculatus]
MLYSPSSTFSTEPSSSPSDSLNFSSFFFFVGGLCSRSNAFIFCSVAAASRRLCGRRRSSRRLRYKIMNVVRDVYPYVDKEQTLINITKMVASSGAASESESESSASSSRAASSLSLPTGSRAGGSSKFSSSSNPTTTITHTNLRILSLTISISSLAHRRQHHSHTCP